MKKIVIILLSISFVSCIKEKDDVKINKQETQLKNYLLPNDEYREKILPLIQKENNRKKLIELLNILDEHKMSFCDFNKRELQIDDSCYDIALKKYPNPDMQQKFAKLSSKIYDEVHPKFLKKLNLSEKDADFLTTVYSFDMNSRKFCNPN